MMRPVTLTLALLLLPAGAAAAAAAAGTAARANDKPVRVEQGLLSGVTAASGVTVYRGIPYAAPPVGPLRWRPPQPAAPWTGVRRAAAFGPSAIQLPHPLILPLTVEAASVPRTDSGCADSPSVGTTARYSSRD